ncbi:helix-turn-helix domain-containing protein [Peribacillus asahii]|uniref:helix-turn-helix domain-containing protein n=1 Tax=Peribacillus asahii TaxID=228899 RepID=UPI0038267C02
MVHENVEKIRIAKGITKTHIANKLNMSLQGYRHITSGEVRLDVERLKVIANVLGVNPAVFFDSELTKSVIEEIESKTA